MSLFKFLLDGMSDRGTTSNQVASTQKLLELVTQSFVEEDYVRTSKCVCVGRTPYLWGEEEAGKNLRGM